MTHIWTGDSIVKRVLITGASGFIGSGVLKYLLDNTDWEFVCICSWRHRGNPLNIEPSSRVQVITHDLAGPLPEIGIFTYILHLASESHVDRSIQDPVSFIENNVSSTLQVLEYARKYPPEAFILFSTDEVFGATEHAEWDVLLPSNPYAASKAAQEMIGIAYWSTYKVPVIITNSNNIVGPNQDKEKFVPKITDIINKGEVVEVHSYRGQPGKRYYNPVQNVADALLFILENPQPTEDRPSRFNIPGGEEIDNLEMAHKISDILGKQLSYKIVDAELVRPGYDQFYPKTEGRLTELGWEPPFSLDSELEGIVNEIAKRS